MPRTLGPGIGLGHGTAGWSPEMLPYLAAWMDPTIECYQDDGLTVPAGIGDPVGGIPDLSGSGRTAQQATLALKPTLAGSQFPSGRRGLTFDGADDRLVILNLGPAMSGSDVPFTVGLVYNVAAGAVNRAVQGIGRSSSTTPYQMLYSNGSSMLTYRRDNSGASKSFTGPAVAPGSAQVVVHSFGELPVVGRSGINGGTEVSADMDVGATTLDRFTIGGVERGGTILYPFLGAIGAWVVCSVALSASDRLLLARWLMSWAGLGG